MEKTPGALHDDKVVLRQKYRNLRRQFKSEEGRAVTEQLTLNLRKFEADIKGQSADHAATQFCQYRARRDEASCLLTPPTDYYFPALKGDEIEFRRPHKKSSFQTNAMAFDEPIPDQSTPLDLSRPTVVFCPAVAIDQFGVRLGLGKGFYDRFFSSNPQVLRVGVVFQVQVSSQRLPAESWDQNMDWLITEKMILRVREGRGSTIWT